MTALDLKNGELGGVVAWHSTHHVPTEQLPTVFAEFQALTYCWGPTSAMSIGISGTGAGSGGVPPAQYT
jgi:hypothetical protein